MKKYLFLIAAAYLFFVSGGSAGPAPAYIPYDDIPESYALDDAKSDNCVVYEDLSITSGQDVWDAFVERTRQNEPAFVRLAFYYTLGDPERYDAKYYEEIKNDYPVMYIQDLEFDGNEYVLSYSEEGNRYVRAYKYMKKFTGELDARSSPISRYTYFVLVNDDTVTWEQLQFGMLSSRFGDYIDHAKVYSDYK